MNEIGDRDEYFPDDDPLDWVEPEPAPADQPRQWTHPSEAGLQARVKVDRRRGRRLAISLVAIGTGVVLGTALVATVLHSEKRSTETVAGQAPLRDCLALVDAETNGDQIQLTGLLVDDDRHVLVSGVDLRDAEEISVRIDGASTAASLVAMDPYSELSLLQLDVSAGTKPSIGTEPNAGDPVRIVQYDHAGRRQSRQAVVAKVGVMWTRPNQTVAANVLTLDGDTTDSGVLVDPGGSVSGIVIGANGAQAVALGIEQLESVVSELARGGIVKRAWLGVRATDTESSIGSGAAVVEAIAGSPAQSAGIAPGDLIVGVGATPVNDLGDLVRATAALEPGESVTVWVDRAGAPLVFEMVVSEYPD